MIKEDFENYKKKKFMTSTCPDCGGNGFFLPCPQCGSADLEVIVDRDFSDEVTYIATCSECECEFTISVEIQEEGNNDKLLVVDFEIGSENEIEIEDTIDNIKDEVNDSITEMRKLANLYGCTATCDYELRELGDHDDICELTLQMTLEGSVENLATFLPQLEDEASGNYYLHTFSGLAEELNQVVKKNFNNSLFKAARDITTINSFGDEVSLYIKH